MAKIYITQPAEYDLIDIEYYIHVDLCKDFCNFNLKIENTLNACYN